MMKRHGLNRSGRAFHHMIGLAALAVAFATLPRPTFGQATSGVSGMRIGIIRIRQYWQHSGHTVGQSRPSGTVLFPAS